MNQLYSPELKNICEILLSKDPNLRPSVEDLLKLNIIKQKIEQLSYDMSEENIRV